MSLWPRRPARSGAARSARPPAGLNVPTGANLELPAKTVLTVGSDCAIGKMTVSLSSTASARAGPRLAFRPDRPDGNRDRRLGHLRRRGHLRLHRRRGRAAAHRGHERGGELLLVEGQGALLHPAYSGVTLGLIHGSAPHVVRALPPGGADRDRGLPGHPLPSLTDLVELHERISLPARKAHCRRDRAEHT